MDGGEGRGEGGGRVPMRLFTFNRRLEKERVIKTWSICLSAFSQNLNLFVIHFFVLYSASRVSIARKPQVIYMLFVLL